jgi:hypothetical protein
LTGADPVLGSLKFEMRRRSRQKSGEMFWLVNSFQPRLRKIHERDATKYIIITSPNWKNVHESLSSL